MTFVSVSIVLLHILEDDWEVPFMIQFREAGHSILVLFMLVVIRCWTLLDVENDSIIFVSPVDAGLYWLRLIVEAGQRDVSSNKGLSRMLAGHWGRTGRFTALNYSILTSSDITWSINAAVIGIQMRRCKWSSDQHFFLQDGPVKSTMVTWRVEEAEPRSCMSFCLETSAFVLLQWFTEINEYLSISDAGVCIKTTLHASY